MTKVWVTRAPNGAVTGIFRAGPPVNGVPVEILDDKSPDVVAFETPSLVPAQVELWKARVAMKTTPWAGNFGGNGSTVFDAARAAVASMPDSAKKRAALEAIDYTNFVTRSGSIMKMIQQALGMTDAQCDALFIQAAAIQS